MSKLFVAVDLPLEIRELLGGLIGDKHPALRLISPEQLHLTLHHIGEGEVARHASALSGVHATSFDMSLAALGSFTHPRGRRTIWMGVQPSEALRDLHRRVADALATVDFVPEQRPFTPHITLARAGTEFSRQALNEVLAQAPPALPAMRIREFSLYSSLRTDGRLHYHRERTFALG